MDACKVNINSSQKKIKIHADTVHNPGHVQIWEHTVYYCIQVTWTVVLCTVITLSNTFFS